MLRRIFVAVVLAGVAVGCARVGGPVAGQPPHHREGGFANPGPGPAPAAGWTRLRFFIARVLASTFAARSASLPRVDNDGRRLRARADVATVTWIGHSSLLVQLAGMNLLTDPQWSDRASPVSFAGPRRVTPPGLQFEDLPRIDVVLISHDHYDHLDVATLRRLHAEHGPRFLVPLGLKAWLAALGITDVVELDWWGTHDERGLTFTCLPARHFSGRGLWDRNQRLWSGWAVVGAGKRFFFAGDTAYDRVFTQIGGRLGPFDLAAVPIGAYLPPEIMHASHTTPEEAVQLFEDVRGQRLVPIHWGTFDLADEPIEEPPVRLKAEAERRGLGPDRVWVLTHGETRTW